MSNGTWKEGGCSPITEQKIVGIKFEYVPGVRSNVKEQLRSGREKMAASLQTTYRWYPAKRVLSAMRKHGG